MTEPSVLELHGITKQFPGVLANDHVDLDVRRGEVHALLGENGAGKTTLMRVLYGLTRPDAGTILIDGRPVAIRSPTDAIAAGSKVVFAVAGPCGFGALAAAKEGGVWGDGVDVDQSYLGPHILTSAVKRVDLGVFRFIQAVQAGTLTPGHDFVFDLKNGGVALGKVSSKVPAAFLAKVNALKAQIIAGTIKPPSAF